MRVSELGASLGRTCSVQIGPPQKTSIKQGSERLGPPQGPHRAPIGLPRPPTGSQKVEKRRKTQKKRRNKSKIVEQRQQKSRKDGKSKNAEKSR